MAGTTACYTHYRVKCYPVACNEQTTNCSAHASHYVVSCVMVCVTLVTSLPHSSRYRGTTGIRYSQVCIVLWSLYLHDIDHTLPSHGDNDDDNNNCLINNLFVLQCNHTVCWCQTKPEVLIRSQWWTLLTNGTDPLQVLAADVSTL